MLEGHFMTAVVALFLAGSLLLVVNYFKDRDARELRDGLSRKENAWRIRGYNEGLEVAARHCEHCADLCDCIIEADLTPEATAYRFRADDIRKMKLVVTEY